jgi:hypothetical protein
MQIRNLSPQADASAISIAHHVAAQRNGKTKAYATGNGERRWPSAPFPVLHFRAGALATGASPASLSASLKTDGL